MLVTVVELDGEYRFLGKSQQFHIRNVPTDEIAPLTLRICGLDVNDGCCRVLMREGRDLLVSATTTSAVSAVRPQVRVFAIKTGRDGANMLDWRYHINEAYDKHQVQRRYAA